MQIIQKIRNLKIYFAFNICVFVCISENGALIYISKNDFEIYKTWKAF